MLNEQACWPDLLRRPTPDMRSGQVTGHRQGLSGREVCSIGGWEFSIWSSKVIVLLLVCWPPLKIQPTGGTPFGELKSVHGRRSLPSKPLPNGAELEWGTASTMVGWFSLSVSSWRVFIKLHLQLMAQLAPPACRSPRKLRCLTRCHWRFDTNVAWGAKCRTRARLHAPVHSEVRPNEVLLLRW